MVRVGVRLRTVLSIARGVLFLEIENLDSIEGPICLCFPDGPVLVLLWAKLGLWEWCLPRAVGRLQKVVETPL